MAVAMLGDRRRCLGHGGPDAVGRSDPMRDGQWRYLTGFGARLRCLSPLKWVVMFAPLVAILRLPAPR